MRSINDPRLLPQAEMPFHFVLSNQTTSLIAWAINWKTRANFDHCMQAINSGKFISQDFRGYHEIPMDQYLIKGGDLKFIKIVNATETFNIAFRSVILNRMAQPWYKKLYDYGNILGRAVGLNWLHMPGTYDCSEVSVWAAKQCAMYLPQEDAAFIMGINPQSSPDDIDMLVKGFPNRLSYYGYWAADEGVVT